MKKNNEYASLAASAVLELLHSNEHGLSSAEAQQRLITYGTNELPEIKRDGVFLIFFRQFKSPLIFILHYCWTAS
jgi:Ca2+-transporting ATPase